MTIHFLRNDGGDSYCRYIETFQLKGGEKSPVAYT